jgi:hypothetical protein
MQNNHWDAMPAKGILPLSEVRAQKEEADLRFWLENMLRYHRYSLEEAAAVIGLPVPQIEKTLQRWNLDIADRPHRSPGSPLRVLPYPGGRHPRIGFLEGAIDPQRETKVSVFPPWDEESYVVVDVPEALWSNLGLTYLAHTHIPTLWTQQGIPLPHQEWVRAGKGTLTAERRLPNGIVFGAKILPRTDGVRMELWLENGTNAPLTDLRVQNCVLLKGARGFTDQTSANKVFESPFAACHSDAGNRWVITAWERCFHVWGNAACPCLHSDPRFPDCLPGKRVRLRGWLSFYVGEDIRNAFRRLEKWDWLRLQLFRDTR